MVTAINMGLWLENDHHLQLKVFVIDLRELVDLELAGLD